MFENYLLDLLLTDFSLLCLYFVALHHQKGFRDLVFEITYFFLFITSSPKAYSLFVIYLSSQISIDNPVLDGPISLSGISSTVIII